MLNPDLLFVLNQRNRPTFTPAELDREIRVSTIVDVGAAAAELAAKNRPGLSPAELLVMHKVKVLPVGNPLRSGMKFEHNGETLQLGGRRKKRRRSRNG